MKFNRRNFLGAGAAGVREKPRDKNIGDVTRRGFVWRAAALSAGFAASTAPLPAGSMPLGAATPEPAAQTQAPADGLLAAAEAWGVRLSPDGLHIILSYHGVEWLSQLSVCLKANGQTYRSDAVGMKLELETTENSGATTVKASGHTNFEIVFAPHNRRLEIELLNVRVPGLETAEVEALVHAGADPLQSRLTDVRDDVQQMVSGLAASSLNDCLFDRFRDQALRVKARETRFMPTPSGFRLLAGTKGAQAPICGFEMLDRVYQRRLPYYVPLDKKRWPAVPVGWCSFHYWGNVLTENDILNNARTLAEQYESFGLRYILVDGGWQAHGISGNWTESNADFPHGMKWLTEKIRALGLKSGLWLSEFGTADEGFYNAHKDWFLHDAQGNAKLGTWFGTYIIDFSNPAVKQYLYDAYKEITINWGYDYFKLDGENATRDIWRANRVRAYNPALDADTAFREGLDTLRRAMNLRPGVFFSACGPVYPTESMGIAQSARLGDDILAFSDKDPSTKHSEPPSFRCVRTALEGMRRGFYTHNIAWIADPDGVLARPPLTIEEVRTWFSIFGLTGQLLMLGDNMPALSEERLDIPRKVMPVVDIKPMELFPQDETPHIWVLHMGRSFASWAVVGLFNWDYIVGEVPFADHDQTTPFFAIARHDDELLGTEDGRLKAWLMAQDAATALAENQRLQAMPDKPPGLQLLPVATVLEPFKPRKITVNFAKVGLSDDPEYLVFDFWKQAYLGKFRGEYTGTVTAHACQVVSLRPAAGHPQLIGTDRHVTMGGVELKNEHWDAAARRLTLSVELVKNYPSKFTVYKEGSKFVNASATGASAEHTDADEILTLKLEKPENGAAEVALQFA